MVIEREREDQNLKMGRTEVLGPRGVQDPINSTHSSPKEKRTAPIRIRLKTTDPHRALSRHGTYREGWGIWTPDPPEYLKAIRVRVFLLSIRHRLSVLYIYIFTNVSVVLHILRV